MAEISLYVTPGVVDHTSATPAHQQQIAFKDATPDIAAQLRAANRNRHVRLQLGGLLTIAVGDTGAMWRSHNHDSGDFDALFRLLGRYPGKPMRFVCEVLAGE